MAVKTQTIVLKAIRSSKGALGKLVGYQVTELTNRLLPEVGSLLSADEADKLLKSESRNVLIRVK